MKQPIYCPYCGFHFKVIAVNAKAIPAVAPIICERCAKVGLLVEGVARATTAEELAAIKQSPAWAELLEPLQQMILQERN